MLPFFIFALMKFKINWDAWGIAASLACAIHCAILPLFIASLPLLGSNLIDNHLVEIVMIIVAFIIGLYSLSHGYKEHHHKRLPLLLFCIGMTLLVSKELFHDHHILLLVPAVICIVLAHYLNYRYCRGHNHAHKEDCNHDHY